LDGLMDGWMDERQKRIYIMGNNGWIDVKKKA
jgi:hypothetical protein